MIQFIFDPVFRQNFYYINADNHKKYKRIMKKELKVDIDCDKTTDGGFQVIDVKGNLVAVIWCSKKKPEIIVHECMHAVSWMHDYKGTKLCDETEETYCYSMQFLFGKIFYGDKYGKSF